MATGPAREPAPKPLWEHLTEENLARLTVVLREHVNQVFRANRVIEQRTGYESDIAKQMMVDVLSHLAVLAESTDLTPDQQASQLAKIEEHLRRAIVEHPEEVLRNRIADVDDLWSRYEREAFSLRDANRLTGVPRHKDLEEDRGRIDSLLESARSKKPEETTWDETLSAAAEMTEAAHLTRELANKLDQCIGRAADVRREHATAGWSVARWAVGIAVAIALSVGTYLLGQHNGNAGHTSITKTVTAPAKPPAKTP